MSERAFQNDSNDTEGSGRRNPAPEVSDTDDTADTEGHGRLENI